MIEFIQHHKLWTGLIIYFLFIAVILAVVLWTADSDHSEPV